MAEPSCLLRWSVWPLRAMGVGALLTGLYLGLYQGLLEPLRPGHHFLFTDWLQLAAGLALLAMAFLSLVLSAVVARLLSGCGTTHLEHG